MHPERWRRIRGLFDEVCDLPAAPRVERLDQVAADDPELARYVESLLLDEGELEDVLERPLVSPPSFDPETSGPLPEATLEGERLGPYRLERRIGMGGAGVVYLATRADGAFDQRVAVKVLRPTMASGETIRRLQDERQILANLDHPNVARVFDGGTTTHGLPYLVLEHVDGEPIDRYCDSRRLGSAERLALMRQVCDAVHYAHQNLVVHRDLKPSNILVTAEGRVKLLDFGIAKILDSGVVGAEGKSTEVWVRPMTPSYASPEQIRGEAVTTATDTYALGVLLFELLVGRLPYAVGGKSLSELERLVCELPAPRPSQAMGDLEPELRERLAGNRGVSPKTQRTSLEGDLDTIVEVCLRKEPGQRYGSVRELGDDLRRHLENFPVLARRESRAYRWRRWLRRNRLPAALTASAAAFVVAWGIHATWLLDRVAAERDGARATLDFVKGIVRLADPERAGDEQWTLRQVLDQRSESLDRAFPHQPRIRAELSGLLGQIQLSLGEHEQAQGLLERSLRTWDSLPDPDSAEQVRTLVSLGEVERERGNYTAAAEKARRALDLALRDHGDRHPLTVLALNLDVTVFCYRGDLEPALEPARRALDLAQEVLTPEDPRHVEALTNLAYVRKGLGDLDEAEVLYRRALELHRSLWPGPHPLTADLLANLAALLHRQKRWGEAERLSRESLTMRRTFFDPEDRRIAQSLYNLSQTLRALGRSEEARATLEEALAVLLRRSEVTDPRVVATYRKLAQMQIEADLPRDAIALLTPLLSRWRRDLDPKAMDRIDAVLRSAQARLDPAR
ncbi:MAG: tetratricopeptide repeat protein [Acidobacteriota bacterium]